MHDDPDDMILRFEATPTVKPCVGDAPPLARKPRDYSKPECAHRDMEIDAKLRVIECLGCKERLDPIECLLNLADYYSRLEVQREMLQAYRVKELEKEARDLARKHPLTSSGAVIAGCPGKDPDLGWKRYEAARKAADRLPLADRLGLLVRAKLLSQAELAEILRNVETPVLEPAR